TEYSDNNYQYTHKEDKFSAKAKHVIIKSKYYGYKTTSG
ncbi:MAG: hypothetical protein HW406_2034, partial [Candidatus Brocadiaceae bacterium]|nr:hypothetical protein [Candidatus Brocadiaceae bacterium]